MKVFDFDNTIYDGESLVDFFLFAMKKKKGLIIYLPLIIYTAILYKLGILSISKLEKLAGKLSKVVIKNKQDAKPFIKEFWQKNSKKLKQEYLEMINENDVIITASPRLLIDGIKDLLKTNNIIASEYNVDTGKFDFLCFGENKVKAFKAKYPEEIIEEFYTDSKADTPLIKEAKKVYWVKK